MRRFFCDKCGKDVTDTDYFEFRLENTGPFGTKRKIDLCENCAKAMIEWIYAKEKKDEND